MDDELIDLIANEDKIVKYLDIPIQHINQRHSPPHEPSLHR